MGLETWLEHITVLKLEDFHRMNVDKIIEKNL